MPLVVQMSAGMPRNQEEVGCLHREERGGGRWAHRRLFESTGGHPERAELEGNGGQVRGMGEVAKASYRRLQGRHPVPDGKMHPARIEVGKSLTFLTMVDGLTWLASVQMRIALGQWVRPPHLAVLSREKA